MTINIADAPGMRCLTAPSLSTTGQLLVTVTHDHVTFGTLDHPESLLPPVIVTLSHQDAAALAQQIAGAVK